MAPVTLRRQAEPSQPRFAEKTPAAAAQSQPSPRPRYFWDDTGITGPARIEILLTEQRANFYKGDELVGNTVISSGRRKFETPPGIFKVTQKNIDHVSNLYGDYVDENGTVVKRNVDVTKDPPPPGTTFRGSPMRYFLRFHRGYGLHAGRLPGYPASHGCVRLPRVMARHFYENSRLGTPVIVQE